MRRVLLPLILLALSAAAPPAVSEREKFEAERAEKSREIAVTERAQQVAAEDLAFRRSEADWSHWASPLVLAIIAALIAALSNAFVAWWNGRSQRALDSMRSADNRQLERDKADAQREVDERKSESDRILEVIKTGGDPIRAAQNMQFLVDAGLVTKPGLLEKLQLYLKNLPLGAGPSLPTRDGAFKFQRSADLTPMVEAGLKATLNQFVAYLETIGFSPTGQELQIQVGGEIAGQEWDYVDARNAFFSPNKHTLFIGIDLRDDPDVVCRTYMEYALTNAVGHVPDHNADDPVLLSILYALADYYVCSYTGKPGLAENSAAVFGREGRYLRTLNVRQQYVEAAPQFDDAGDLLLFEHFEHGLIWSSMFWALRSALGRDETDRLLFAAWTAVPRSKTGLTAAFIDTMLDKAPNDESRAATLNVLQQRGFPLSGTTTPAA